MKRLHIVCFLFFVAGILIGLIQLWCSPWSAELFFKLIVTDSAFFVIALVLAIWVKENKESQKITKGNGLD